MKNYSVMKCIICNNDKSGEFITIYNKKYHLCCIEHQKKVIDRLSRKIQKLKQRTTKHDVKEVLNLYHCMSEFKYIKEREKVEKALQFIEDCWNSLSVKEVAELKEILGGKQ